MRSITLTQPDDFHVHFRNGAMLRTVVPYTARVFGRAMVMPNLVPPICTIEHAVAYRAEIMAAVPEGISFQPLITCYLTANMDPVVLQEGYKQSAFFAAKLYPAHATTHSAQGISDIKSAYPLFEAMQKIGMPLLIHGEVTDPDIDIFDREAIFIDRVLLPLLQNFPALKVTMEHITTAYAAGLVNDLDGKIAATITPQHLQYTRNDLLVGGIKPHLYCLPILKAQADRKALRAAAISGKKWYFLGTDTAPHAKHTKENACGCAGIFSAPCAIESYAAVFAEENALDRLEGFASLHGAAWYDLPVNSGKVTLDNMPFTVPDHMDIPGTADHLVPYHAGQKLGWSVKNS